MLGLPQHCSLLLFDETNNGNYLCKRINLLVASLAQSLISMAYKAFGWQSSMSQGSQARPSLAFLCIHRQT